MIETTGLSISYGTKTALADISLTIPAGQITAIVGPSGCGKSSFLSALNRMTDLIDGASVTGQVLVDCCDIYDRCRNPAQLRRCVGMIFQKPNPFPMSIKKNIQLALREHGMRGKKQLDEITEKVLRDVGLWDEVKDRLGDSAIGLSGGQQQRLCIARTLALEPQVLLMDEPCSSLDPIASSKVEALIENLRGRYTVVIVTHNLAQARRISDQLALFWIRNGAGQLIEHGPTAQVFENPQDSTAANYFAGIQG